MFYKGLTKYNTKQNTSEGGQRCTEKQWQSYLQQGIRETLLGLTWVISLWFGKSCNSFWSCETHAIDRRVGKAATFKRLMPVYLLPVWYWPQCHRLLHWQHSCGHFQLNLQSHLWKSLLPASDAGVRTELRLVGTKASPRAAAHQCVCPDTRILENHGIREYEIGWDLRDHLAQLFMAKAQSRQGSPAS